MVTNKRKETSPRGIKPKKMEIVLASSLYVILCPSERNSKLAYCMTETQSILEAKFENSLIIRKFDGQ